MRKFGPLSRRNFDFLAASNCRFIVKPGLTMAESLDYERHGVFDEMSGDSDDSDQFEAECQLRVDDGINDVDDNGQLRQVLQHVQNAADLRSKVAARSNSGKQVHFSLSVHFSLRFISP